jgi:hypothetical protein
MNIFLNVIEEYVKVHGVYPRLHDQLPEFLTSLGFPCEYDIIYVPATDPVNAKVSDAPTPAKRLKMEDEIATALVLRL